MWWWWWWGGGGGMWEVYKAFRLTEGGVFTNFSHLVLIHFPQLLLIGSYLNHQFPQIHIIWIPYDGFLKPCPALQLQKNSTNNDNNDNNTNNDHLCRSRSSGAYSVNPPQVCFNFFFFWKFHKICPIHIWGREFVQIWHLAVVLWHPGWQWGGGGRGGKRQGRVHSDR